jgi:hypothetical protein
MEIEKPMRSWTSQIGAFEVTFPLPTALPRLGRGAFAAGELFEFVARAVESLDETG